MKCKLLFILIFVFVTSAAAQQGRVGAGLTAGLPTDNTSLAGGFDVFIEYKTESPFSFRTGGGFAVTKFDAENVYFDDLSYSLYWIEGTLTYYPLKTEEFVPYLAGGIGYYIISHEDFNIIQSPFGTFEPESFNSKISYHIKAGFVIPVQSSIMIHLQGKYLFFNQNLIVHAEEFMDEELIKTTIETEVDLSTFYITVGAIFNF